MKFSPYIVGHRGTRTVAPENTMLAFEKAHQAGVNRIELDLRRTADDRLVVIHDETVDRTTNGRGKVCDLTLAQVKTLDAGQDQGIPTLAEVLEWSKERLPLNIEVKDTSLTTATLLKKQLQAHPVKDPWVTSSDTEFVEAFQEMAPEVRTGVVIQARPMVKASLVGAALGATAGLALGIGLGVPAWATGLTTLALGMTGAAYGRETKLDRMLSAAAGSDLLVPNVKLVGDFLLSRASKRGQEVIPYTVNSLPEALELLEQPGVTGIITDRPELTAL